MLCSSLAASVRHLVSTTCDENSILKVKNIRTKESNTYKGVFIKYG